VEGIKSKANSLSSAVTGNIDKGITALKGTLSKWVKAGKDIMQGLVDGIKAGASGVVTAIKEAVQSAIDAAKALLLEQSPSKVFEKIGAYTMEGFAEGVDKYAGMAYDSVARAMSGATVPAMATTNNYSTTNHMNLNINSSARREPIIQDFNMLQSLVG
jgi:phage-related protein